MAGNVLIVDDEGGHPRIAQRDSARRGAYAVETVGSGEDCLAKLDEANFDVILLDVWLPKLDGLETLERIQTREAPPAVVMISGHGNIETAVRATKTGRI